MEDIPVHKVVVVHTEGAAAWLVVVDKEVSFDCQRVEHPKLPSAGVEVAAVDSEMVDHPIVKGGCVAAADPGTVLAPVEDTVAAGVLLVSTAVLEVLPTHLEHHPASG